jgi:parallel beta-helix repeat protein
MRTRATAARRMALAGMLGGALLASAGPAAAGTAAITSCSNDPITMSGTYVLATDLSCPIGINGVLIEASNVHLVLNGHTITGLGPNTTDRVAGITARGSSSNRLTGVRIEGGTLTGFPLAGIFVINASGLRISGVTASGNGGILQGVGVLMADCPGCRVVDSVTSDNVGDGIAFVRNTRNALIANDTATGNGRDGIALDGSATGVRVTDNVATGNDQRNTGRTDW